MSMKETDRRWLPAERDALASEAIGGPSLTYWQDCWHRLCRNKTALLSMVVVVICLLYTSPSPRDGATSRMPSSA